jgi:hypothetical protein
MSHIRIKCEKLIGEQESPNGTLTGLLKKKNTRSYMGVDGSIDLAYVILIHGKKNA